MIALTTAGEVDPEGLESAEESISAVLGLRARRVARLERVADSWDASRQQYSSTVILKNALAVKPEDTLRILVLTEHDIFIPMLTFVYGQAQLGGAAAIVSFARLRQEFYGLLPDPSLFLERVAKETLHELGHTLGLTHCSDPLCAMALSTNVQQLDRKTDDYCGTCRKLLARTLPASTIGSPALGEAFR